MHECGDTHIYISDICVSQLVSLTLKFRRIRKGRCTSLSTSVQESVNDVKLQFIRPKQPWLNSLLRIIQGMTRHNSTDNDYIDDCRKVKKQG